MKLKVIYFTFVNISSEANGGAICCRNRIKCLSKDSGIDLSVMIAGFQEHEAEILRFLESLNVSSKFVAFKEQKSIKPRKFLEKCATKQRMLLDKFIPLPWYVFAKTQPHVDQALVEAIAFNSQDILLLEYFYSSLFCRKAIKAAPKSVLLNHNREAKLYRGFLKSRAQSLIKRFVSTLSLARLMKVEYFMSRLMDKTVALAPQEAYRSKGTYVTPHLEMKELQWRPNASQTIFFVGSVSHYLNKEAIDAIITELAPAVSSLIPDVRFKVIGASPSDVSIHHPSVDLLGESDAEEVQRQFLNCQLFICPFKKNLDLRMKVLEALSYGTPFLLPAGMLQRIPYLQALPSLALEDPIEAAKAIVATIKNEKSTADLARNIRHQHLSFIRSQGDVWSRLLQNI